MIINTSRIKKFKLCKRAAFNLYHRNIGGPKSMNLTDGAAFHAGVAAGRASQNWAKAEEAALAQFDEDVKTSAIMPEQLYLIDEHRELVKAMLTCFKEQYEHETYQVIQPECEFDVAIPHSEHHCIFRHWWNTETMEDVWTPPTAEDILAHRVAKPLHRGVCHCYQPHRIVGKTDAIIYWNGNVWIDDYKTSSIDGAQFWDQWWLDVQMTVYLYGVWKSLNLRPRGFQIHMMFKPSEAQVNSWNGRRKSGPSKSQKDYVRLSREAYFRTEEDLARIEHYILDTAQEWETEITSADYTHTPFQFNPSSHTCLSYNRKCDYFSACLNHEQPAEFEALSGRTRDYVDEKLVQIQEVK